MTDTALAALGLSLLSLVLVGATAATAQPSRDACFGTDAGIPVSLRIDSCTGLIQSGGLSQDILAVAFQNRGTAYLGKGDNDRAIEDYDQAIRLDPNYANAFNSRGVAYQNKGDNERAIQDYDQAIRLDPDDANALNGRCWLRAALRQLQAALADCNQSLRVTPNSSNSLDSRGFVYIRLGRWDDAMTDADAALRANGRNAWALFERGIVKLHNGDREGGDADIFASRAIDPKAEMEFAGFDLRP